MRNSLPIVQLVLCASLQFYSCRENKTANISPLIAESDSTLISKAQNLFQKGKIHEEQLQIDSAIYYYDQALLMRERLPKNNLLIINYLTLAEIYIGEFKYEVAKQYLEKARLAANEFTLDPELQIELHSKSADVSANMLDYATSLSLLQKNLSIIGQHYSSDSAKLANTYHLMGVNYLYVSRNDEAVNHIIKSTTFLRKNDYQSLARANSTLGTIYENMGDATKAIQYYNKAIANNLKLSSPLSDRLAIVYLQKAFALIDLNVLDSAQYYLRTNLAIRRNVYGEKNINTFGAKYSLAEFYYAEELYDSAIFYYQGSLTSLIGNFNSANVDDNPAPTISEFNPDLIIALVGKANSLVKLSNEGNKLMKLKLALQSYLLADSVFTIYKSNYAFDDQQLRQLEKGYIPYHNMVNVTEQLFQLTGDLHYIEEALNVMESARASILQASLKRAEVLIATGMESPLIKKENELKKTRLEILQRLGALNQSSDKLEYLTDSLLKVDNNLTKLQLEMKRINPNYYNAQYNISPIRLVDVQRYLQQQNACLIEYLWGKEFVFAIVIQSGGIKIYKSKITRELEEAIRLYSNELKLNSSEVHQAVHFQKFIINSKRVYEELIAPLLNETLRMPEKIIISADGILATFPFESLISKLPPDDEVNYHLDYLINASDVSYVYSTRVLLNQSKNHRHGRKLLAMGFAGNGSTIEKRSSLSNLPGTEEEVVAIKSVMKNGKNKYLLENEASESQFKELIKDFNLTHLALHGIGDTLDALQSRLIFRAENDANNDGNLYAHELYDMDLKNLDLAVLSACESGVGKEQTGEGVMSIARGFAYSGCPSLVISLWKINDKASAKIMSNFYQHLAKGDNIDRSLTLSKVNYLSEANEYNSHPTYWAAFLMFGDTSSIQSNAQIGFWMLTILALITLSYFSFRFFYHH